MSSLPEKNNSRHLILNEFTDRMLWSGFGVSAEPFLFLIFIKSIDVRKGFTSTTAKAQDTFFDASVRDPDASLKLPRLNAGGLPIGDP